MSDAPFTGRRLHFVGIGGAGMSGLAPGGARASAREVSGSDRAESSYSQRLRAQGIEPAIGHDAANVPEGAEVVVSTAIPESNPELAAARAAGARVLHRGELLGEVSRLKRSIAVSGTHGKTTTSGMVAHVLAACGREPAFLIGGELRSAGTNAAWGEGEWIVVEADESDRSFLHLAPRRGGDHQRGARPPRHLPLAVGAAGGVRGVRRAGRHRDRRTGRRARRAPSSTGSARATCAPRTLSLRPLGSSFEVEGQRRGAQRARRAQRAQRAGGAGGLPRGGGRPGRGGARRWPATRARGGGSRTAGARPRARGCSTTTPTTRPRCAPPWRPLARWAPSGWWPAFSPTSIRAPASWRASSAARWRWPTSWWSATSIPRASGRRTSRA